MKAAGLNDLRRPQRSAATSRLRGPDGRRTRREADRLASYLERRVVPGVQFEPARFTPRSSTHAGHPCGGVRVVLLDRRQLDAPALGLELLAALHRLYGDEFALDRTLGLVGARWVLQAIREGEAPDAIVRRWQSSSADFLARRARYLAY